MTVFESITSQNLPPVHVQKLHAVAQLAIYSELTAGLAPQLLAKALATVQLAAQRAPNPAVAQRACNVFACV